MLIGERLPGPPRRLAGPIAYQEVGGESRQGASPPPTGELPLSSGLPERASYRERSITMVVRMYAGILGLVVPATAATARRSGVEK